jgi:hypothetical protein
MTATSAVPIDIVPVGQTNTNAGDDAFDPLPDETVLKTGWLMKKGRRGVNLPFCGIKVNIAELESPLVCVEVGQTGVLQRRKGNRLRGVTRVTYDRSTRRSR